MMVSAGDSTDSTFGVSDFSRRALREVRHVSRQIGVDAQSEKSLSTEPTVDTAHVGNFDFFDLAPVGYVTVDDAALIMQANLTTAALLGIPRHELIGRTLTGFMLRPDVDFYYLLIQLALTSAKAQTCDLRLRQSNGNPVWVSLQAIVASDDEGKSTIRIVLSDITSRKLMEARMMRGDADIRAYLDGASDAIFINDLKGRFQYVNQQAVKLLGFSRDELLGMCVTDITPAEDFELTRRMLAHLMATGSLRYEPSLLRRDGSTVSAELSGALLSNGQGFAACRDISERKQAEALRSASHKFRDAILDSVPSQIAVLDSTGTIVAVNQTWREFALQNSATPGELAANTQIGVNYLDICNTSLGGNSSESATLARDGILSVIDGTQPVFRLEYPCDSPNGQRWFAMAVTPFNVENPGVVVTHTDITEQRQLRDHLLARAVETEMAASRQQLRALVAFNATAIEAERKHIARDVHDELGQVLTALRMDMSVLNMHFGTLDPALPAKVADMKVLVDRAIQGVRNVATSLRPTALDMGLSAALENLCAEFAKRTGIACTFSAQQDATGIDETRAVEVYRIVQESLTNINRYAHASEVQVTMGYRHRALGVEVRDNGQGFRAADVQQAKSFGILGMRERALALGGNLDIVSVPGQGTVVGLTIPVKHDAIETTT